MLNFIYGRVGSGKTTMINNMILSLTRSGYENILLVVPEQFSFSAERAMLDILGPVDCNRVEVVTSFKHIYDTVKKEYGKEKLPEIDEGVKAMLMSLALSSVSDKLDYYSRQRKNGSFVAEMVRISDEFKNNALSDKDIGACLNNMDNSVLKKKLKEISLILSAYEALLSDRYYDPNDRLTRLYDILGEVNFFENKIIFLDGFNGFSQQEIKIIERMLVQAKDVYVSVCCDKIVGDNEEYGVFSYVKKNVKKIIDVAEKHSVRIKMIHTDEAESEKYRNKEILFLEKNLYNPDYSVYEEQPENIKLCKARNISDECRYVANEVKKIIAGGNVRCRDIAIISRSGEDYDEEIKFELNKYGIDVFNDKRQEIKSQPLTVLVQSAFEIATFGFNSERLIRCIKTGLFDVDGKDVSQFENYIFIWGVEGEQLNREFSENPSGLGSGLGEKEKILLKKINEVREKTVSPLAKFRDKIKNGANGEEAASAVYNLLSEINAGENLKKKAIYLEENGEPELAEEQERIWDTMMDILNDMAMVISKANLSASEIKNLFEIVISVQNLGKIPQGIDEVLVGDAERTRIGSPKIVFVMGVNSGVFPFVPSENGLFSRKDRLNLSENGLDLDDKIEMKLLEERFISYNTFAGATKKLFVSYSAFDYSGEELYPSELIFQLKKIFPEIEEKDFSLTDSFDTVGSVETAYEVLASRWKIKDEKTASLKKYLSEKDEYCGKVKMLEEAENGRNFNITNPETAEKLFGKTMYLSASKIEDYYGCAFKYFCRFGLKALPAQPAKLDSRIRGTVVHYCLEILLKQYGVDSLTEMNRDELKHAIKTTLDGFAEENLGGMEGKTNRFKALYKRFEKIVLELITEIIEEFSVSKFRPADFELKIDRDGDIPMYEIPIEGKGKICIHGFVDRVDTMEYDGKTCVKIVDYKTGSKEFNLYEIVQGLNLQMFVYLFSIWENGQEKYGDIIPAGVLYKPAKVSLRTASRNETEEETDKEHSKQHRSFGAVIDNSDIIDGMEKGIKGRFINVEYKEKKDSQILTGDIISLAEMGKLKEKVDKLIFEMGNELLDGKTEPHPVKKDSKFCACDYCDYQDVCETGKEKDYRNIVKLKRDEIFDGTEGGEDRG